MDIAYRKLIGKNIHETESSLEASLKEHGFGVLTKVDVKSKLNEKGVEFDKDIYLLGVCNPKQAKEVLEIDDTVALMLPCSIVLYERENGTEIALAKPTAITAMLPEGERLTGIAQGVEETLRKAVDAVDGGIAASAS